MSMRSSSSTRESDSLGAFLRVQILIPETDRSPSTSRVPRWVNSSSLVNLALPSWHTRPLAGVCLAARSDHQGKIEACCSCVMSHYTDCPITAISKKVIFASGPLAVGSIVVASEPPTC